MPWLSLWRLFLQAFKSLLADKWRGSAMLSSTALIHQVQTLLCVTSKLCLLANDASRFRELQIFSRETKVMVFAQRTEVISHSRAVASSDAEQTSRPSGDAATQFT